MSAAGTRLNNLTGVAAILRYELPDLEDWVAEQYPDEGDEGDLDSDEEGEISANVSPAVDASSKSSQSNNQSEKEVTDGERSEESKNQSENGGHLS